MMRLNELFETSILSEYDWDKLYLKDKDPDKFAAAKKQLGQQKYINNFVAKGIESLKRAIELKNVDVNVDSQKQARIKSTLDKTGVLRSKQQAATQNLNKYVATQAQLISAETNKDKKFDLVKKLINHLSSMGDSPNWDNAAGTVKKVLKTAGFDPLKTRLLVAALNSKQTVNESILNEQVTGVADYINLWFNAAVKNLPYDKALADRYASNIENNLRQNKGVIDKDIQNVFADLANLAWNTYATAEKSKAMPKQAMSKVSSVNQTAQYQTSEPIKFGGETYTRTNKGWVDRKGTVADQNTAKILDMAASKA
jgi:hypothetical protein